MVAVHKTRAVTRGAEDLASKVEWDPIRKDRPQLLQVYLERSPVAYGTSFLARVLMLNSKRRWFWGFWGALNVMGEFPFRHSQWLTEFVSTECQVQGDHVTLGKREHDFSTQHHRFGGGRSTRLSSSYSNRARNHTAPPRHTVSPRWLRVCTFSREGCCE